jgi:hypothetical protein
MVERSVDGEQVALGEPEARAHDGVGVARELLRLEQRLALGGGSGDGGDGRTVP